MKPFGPFSDADHEKLNRTRNYVQVYQGWFLILCLGLWLLAQLILWSLS